MADRVKDLRYGVLDSADRLAHPLLRRLYDDWRTAPHVDGGLPGHDFIDPLKLNYLLGQLLIVGVVRPQADTLRFHYRLIGTDLVARRGRDSTGLWMDEHYDPTVAASGPLACRLAVEARQPVYITAARWIDGKRYALEYLLLPLVDGASHMIDRLLIAQLYPADAPRLPYAARRSG
ncbi:PAS domain-containing protein [Ferrovibrio terrae]|uniref:PAS domain-containing protein n=1 Tax=Ferrovibrio terrae TaxID=2594003 RepID=UPI00313841CD